MSNLFVWDLHGVLEIGNEKAVLSTSNLILGEEGYSERFSKEDINLLYGTKWHEYFDYLLPHLDKSEHLRLERRCVQFGLEHPEVIEEHVLSTGYAHEILGRINKAGHSQILISNVSEESLGLFMGLIGADYYFPGGHAFATNVQGQNRTKKEVLEEFIESSDIKFDKVVSVGDSPSDIELVEGYPNGVSFLYSHPGKGFRDCAPTYKIKDLRCVLREV
jgi:phosphoglycolate phosphatase-like HAD superfamily hydrolase